AVDAAISNQSSWSKDDWQLLDLATQATLAIRVFPMQLLRSLNRRGQGLASAVVNGFSQQIVERNTRDLAQTIRQSGHQQLTAGLASVGLRFWTTYELENLGRIVEVTSIAVEGQSGPGVSHASAGCKARVE